MGGEHVMAVYLWRRGSWRCRLTSVSRAGRVPTCRLFGSAHRRFPPVLSGSARPVEARTLAHSAPSTAQSGGATGRWQEGSFPTASGDLACRRERCRRRWGRQWGWDGVLRAVIIGPGPLLSCCRLKANVLWGWSDGVGEHQPSAGPVLGYPSRASPSLVRRGDVPRSGAARSGVPGDPGRCGEVAWAGSVFVSGSVPAGPIPPHRARFQGDPLPAPP